MPSPEGYNPNLPENINARNEAHDINEMVEKNLISRQEAGEFDYAEEIEISPHLLSKPPKVSERMLKHVVSKFPPESFEPENIDGRLIHGTSIWAIKPIWLAEGKRRTHEGNMVVATDQGFFGGKIAKDYFYVHGDWTKLGRKGFNHLDEKTERTPGAIEGVQIFLINSRRANYQGYRSRHVYETGDKYSRHDSIVGVVLSTSEGLSVEHLLADSNKYLESADTETWKYEIISKQVEIYKKLLQKNDGGNLYQVGHGKHGYIYLTLEQEANYIANCMIEGVDKSKIVPIYDWDGNLLWPTENDVAKENPGKELSPQK